MGEKFPPQKILSFQANKIAQFMGDITSGRAGRARRKHMTATLAEELGVTSLKMGRMVNNIDQPTGPQLAIIAQMLKVKTDDLIKLEE